MQKGEAMVLLEEALGALTACLILAAMDELPAKATQRRYQALIERIAEALKRRNLKLGDVHVT